MFVLCIILISIVCFVLFGIVQFLLCRKSKNPVIKLIPVFVLVLVTAGDLYLYFGDFPYAQRFFNMNEIYALLAAFPITDSMLGAAAGGFIALIMKKRTDSLSKQEIISDSTESEQYHQ